MMAGGNSLYLADLTNISKSIWDIGQRYQTSVLKKIEYNPRNLKNPVALTKLWYLTYMNGGRIGEQFRKPYPKLTILTLRRWTLMHVEKINEKHFRSKQEGIREIITQNIPIDDFYEKRMWDYITDMGQNMNTSRWLECFGEYSDNSRTSITNRFKSSFKGRLTDGEEVFENRGINPHMLRHLRAYNLLINKGYEPRLIQSFFGWTKASMLEYYTYIRNSMKDIEQLQILERMLSQQSGSKNIEFTLGE